jgi:hypothetical protein|tara:strand:- start:256 stop:963 length:708 start_codon:yes stop_codon:yes gene_type:complete
MGSARQHAMEKRLKPQGMSPRRKSSPEAIAKAKAAYAEMMKKRLEALKKRKQRPTGTPVPKQKPTGTPVPQTKEYMLALNARRKKQAEARKKQAEARARFIANRQRNSKDVEIRMKQLAIDTGRTKGTKSTVGDRSVDIEKRMSQLAIERGLKKPQAKESPASIAARKRFNDRLKKQTATYNRTKQKPTLKPTTAKQKGIPPSAIKKMNEANKKMQAKVFGGGKKPTSKRTFART